MYCKNCGQDKGEKERCPHCGQGGGGKPNPGRRPGFLLEDDEKVVEVLQRGLLEHLAFGEGLGSEYVVLTDRRLYSGGTIVGRMAGKVGRFAAQVVIPLEEVSGVVFMQSSNVGLLILAGLLFVVGFFGAAMRRDGEVLTVIAWIPALILLGLYFLTRKNLLVISSSSAAAEIEYKLYGAGQIRGLMCALGRAMREANARGAA